MWGDEDGYVEVDVREDMDGDVGYRYMYLN